MCDVGEAGAGGVLITVLIDSADYWYPYSSLHRCSPVLVSTTACVGTASKEKNLLIGRLDLDVLRFESIFFLLSCP
jgi:hypothetical protein